MSVGVLTMFELGRYWQRMSNSYPTLSFDQKMKNIIKSQQKSQNSKVNTDSCMAQEYVDKYDQANAIDSKGSSLHYWKNEHDTRHPVALLMSKLACYYLTPPPTSHLL